MFTDLSWSLFVANASALVCDWRKMALRTWEVEVFNVTEEIVCNPKYNKKVKLRADYDPQGISIKLLDGTYSKYKQFTVKHHAGIIIFLFLLLSILSNFRRLQPVMPSNQMQF
jgi:hypothetical protein